VPEALHGRLFALHKTCTSAAFVIAFLLAGVLISTLGIQAMFLCGGLALIVIILVVRPPLRELWPEPPSELDAPGQLRPQPGTT
jgi:MFS family permease